MINLLPPQQKKEILNEEKFKLVFILAVLALFFLSAFCLLLLSIKFYTMSKTENQKIIAEKTDNSLEGEITLINQKLTKLNDFYQEQADFTVFLEELSSVLPEGLYLINLSATVLPPVTAGQGEQEEKKFNVILAGFASTRQLLLEFKEKLDVNPNFSGIDFPQSNWVKNENIDFTVIFKTKL